MRLPEEKIEEIRRLADIVDIVSEYIALQPAGKNYKARSPFTNEKTPSFFVSPDKQIYKCFSSGKGGNVFTFVM
jgi:DNA primase